MIVTKISFLGVNDQTLEAALAVDQANPEACGTPPVDATKLVCTWLADIRPRWPSNRVARSLSSLADRA